MMEKSANQGMQTFDMSLLQLYNQGLISQEEALKNADSANNLRLKITLRESLRHNDPEADETDDDAAFPGDTLQLEPIRDDEQP